jgi:hypothetical protein
MDEHPRPSVEKHDDETAHEEGQQTAENSSQPLVSPPQPLPTSRKDPYAHGGSFMGTQFDASPFFNSEDFDQSPDRLGLDYEHLNRIPSGASVIDVHSVYDDSGRSFHGYKQGKYFLPNDAVSRWTKTNHVPPVFQP